MGCSLSDDGDAELDKPAWGRRALFVGGYQMADLDEVSSQIGELIAMTRSTQNQVGTLFGKYDSMKEEQLEQRGAIKLLGAQSSENKHGLVNAQMKVAAIEKTVDEAKNKGKGFAIALGLLGGGGGMAGFAAAFKGLFGGN